MTDRIFQEWLSELDKDMRRQNCHIALTLDNAPIHIWDGMELTNTTMTPLPPNTTAFIQACDAGIINDFKVKYRKKVCRRFIALA